MTVAEAGERQGQLAEVVREAKLDTDTPRDRTASEPRL